MKTKKRINVLKSEIDLKVGSKKNKCRVCGIYISEKWMLAHIEREHSQMECNSRRSSQGWEEPAMQVCSRTLNVGPSFSENINLLMKKPEKSSGRDIFIITEVPRQNQETLYKIEEVVSFLKEYNGRVVVFDSVLGTLIASMIDPFFTRGRHEDLDVYNISESNVDLPKTTIRNNSK